MSKPKYDLQCARTVGQLIEELQKLPASMPVEMGFSRGCIPVVLTHCSTGRRLLELRENDGLYGPTRRKKASQEPQP